MKKAIVSGALMLALTTGCNAQPPAQNDVSSYDTKVENRTTQDKYFGLGPVADYYSNRNNNAADSFDGNETPEFTNIGTKNHNIGHDQGMLRHTVEENNQFSPKSVAINGDKAFVYAIYDGKDDQFRKSYQKLKSDLQRQMPRYQVVLKVTNR